MEIPFVQRSEFLDPCAEALRRQPSALAEGGIVRIELKAGGYPGRVRVHLERDNRTYFRAAWGSDATRFPQRIRTAATALRDLGESGNFEIAHADGTLEIRRVEESV